MLPVSRYALVPLLLLGASLPGLSQQKKTSKAGAPRSPVPQFQISFEQTDPIKSLNYLPVFALPFECTSDGTVYVEMLHSASLVDPSSLSSRFLAGITPSGEIHSYSPVGTPDLRNITELGHFVWDSGTAFLVRAASADADEKSGDYHDFIVTFGLDGERRDTVPINDDFHADKFGVFPSSGYFLIYGYDAATDTPRLALFNNNGTLLKDLHLPKSLMRDSATLELSEQKKWHVDKVMPDKSATGTGQARKGPGIIAPVEFVPYLDTMILVQANTDFPLVKIRDSGTIQIIPSRLPQGEQISSLISSDGNLFARVNNGPNGSIYEIDPETGKLLREFKTTNDEGGHNIACVHEGKFLSFEHDWEHNHALIPLWGTPEPYVDSVAASN